MKKLSVVILAAGEGTRMKSRLPKVLHELGGMSIIKWVLSVAKSLSPEKIILVVGHESKQVKKELADSKIIFVEQKKQLGTANALLQTKKYLGNYKNDILVLCGDAPLLQRPTLVRLIDSHKKNNNDMSILSAEAPDPFSYGRIVRAPYGNVLKIVEEKDAIDSQKKIKEINSGVYCFKSPLVWEVLKSIKTDNKKHEYYLTDTVEILNSRNRKVSACQFAEFCETLGINNRYDLSVAESIIRKQILKKLMLDGVTICDPDNTYISSETKVGNDTIIYPGTIIEGKTSIGSNCVIGPYAHIDNSKIENNVKIVESYILESQIKNGAKIGPFSQLRPGSVIQQNAKVGNFSEVKKSVIGKGAKVNHLSYIGDATLGKAVNVGAGTITCNYDGKNKFKTLVGDRVFIGSNVNFVAPVKIGADSLIGAGSTITENVPSKGLSIARARQVNKKKKEIKK